MKRILLSVLAFAAIFVTGVTAAGAAPYYARRGMQAGGLIVQITPPVTYCSPMTQSDTHGCLVGVTEGPWWIGDGKPGSKVGNSCAYNLLGLFAWGDASIEKAKKQGGISTVSTVDYKSVEAVPRFPLFGMFCTELTGE